MNRPNNKLWRWLAYAAIFVIGCQSLESCVQAGIIRPDEIDEHGELTISIDELVDRAFGADGAPEGTLGFAYSLQAGDEVTTTVTQAGATPPEPVIKQANTPIETPKSLVWFNQPNICFSRPSTIVVVDPANNSQEVAHADWPPMINGQFLGGRVTDFWDQNNWIFSNIGEAPNVQQFPPGKFPVAPIVDVPAVKGSPGRALVVNGWSAGQQDEAGLRDGAYAVNRILRSAGFHVAHLGPVSDPAVDAAATPRSVRDFIERQARDMKPGETFVLYIAGHGNRLKLAEEGPHLGVLAIGGQFLNSLELAASLAGFQNGVAVQTIIEACHSGAFADAVTQTLPQVTGQLITSTDANTPSFFDYDTTYTPGTLQQFDIEIAKFLGYDFAVPEPDSDLDSGPEFTSAFVAGLADILNDPGSLQALQGQSASTGTPFWQAAFAEAFRASAERDLAALNGFTRPQLLPGMRAGQAAVAPAVTDVPPTLAEPPFEPSCGNGRVTTRSGQFLWWYKGKCGNTQHTFAGGFGFGQDAATFREVPANPTEPLPSYAVPQGIFIP